MKWGLVLPLAAIGIAGDAPLQAPRDPCSRQEDGIIYSLPYRDCVELLPPERIRGTWFVSTEGSGFVPEGAPLPAMRVVGPGPLPPDMNVHLDVGWPRMLELLESVPEPQGEGDTGRYAVEFIGRRARDRGEYGHGGLAEKLIVVDRMLSIRPAGRVTTRIRLGDLDCNLADCPSSYTPSH